MGQPGLARQAPTEQLVNAWPQGSRRAYSRQDLLHRPWQESRTRRAPWRGRRRPHRAEGVKPRRDAARALRADRCPCRSGAAQLDHRLCLARRRHPARGTACGPACRPHRARAAASAVAVVSVAADPSGGAWPWIEGARPSICGLRSGPCLLFDSGHVPATTPELGGTGRMRGWTISRAIVARVPRSIFLSGGLRPENVAEAVATVNPCGAMCAAA